MITHTLSEVKTALKIKPVENAEELRRAMLLMTSASRHPSETAYRWLEKNGSLYPHFQREHTRIAVSGNEVIGALRISTDTIRIGETRLKLGGLGWVSVAPGQDRKRIQSGLIENALQYLRKHGYHVSIVFETSRDWRPHGFVEAIMDYSLDIDLLKTPVPADWSRRERAVKPGDIGMLQRMQSLNAPETAASLLRERAHFSNRWDLFKDAVVLADTRGKTEAYLLPRIGTGKLHVEEAEAMTPNAFRDVIVYSMVMARERLMTRVVYHAPPNHPLRRTVTEMVSPEAVEQHSSIAGLLKIVDLDETMESMIPEWESLINRSLLREMDSEVTLLLDGKPYRIRAHFGALDVAQQMGRNKFTLSMEVFTQLLTGYEDIRGVWVRERRLITRDGKALIEALFPSRNPYMPLFDRF
jgi:predicted acetyltransferase